MGVYAGTILLVGEVTEKWTRARMRPDWHIRGLNAGKILTNCLGPLTTGHGFRYPHSLQTWRFGMMKRTTSRAAFIGLMGVGIIALAAWALRSDGPRKLDSNAILPDQQGPNADDAARAAMDTEARANVEKQVEKSEKSSAGTNQPAPKSSDDSLNSPTTTANGREVISRAEAKSQAGDLVTARDMLNEALSSSQLEPDETDRVHSLLSELNKQILFSPKRFNADPYTRAYKVEPGDRLGKIARKFDIPWELLGRLNHISDPSKLRADVTLKAIQGPFHAVVSKSKFTLDVYLGSPGGPESMYVMTFGVGLGSDDSTPTGTWLVGDAKVTNPVYYSPRGEGVVGADDPSNPLGERWIPLVGIGGNSVGQESYGIHGTIEPDSIGKNRSLGCIRLVNEDVEFLYDLLAPGKSKILVVE